MIFNQITNRIFRVQFVFVRGQLFPIISNVYAPEYRRSITSWYFSSMTRRFSLSVGSLFAVIGNKYVIDSALPESTSFTLVDTLHGISLIFVFAVILSSALSLKLIKENKIGLANRFDRVFGAIVFLTYLVLNIYFISKATAN